MEGLTLDASNLHRVTIRNHLLGDKPITTVIVGRSGFASGTALGQAENAKLAPISYRVEAEASGAAHLLAGGLNETVAFGLVSDIQKALGV